MLCKKPFYLPSDAVGSERSEPRTAVDRCKPLNVDPDVA